MTVVRRGILRCFVMLGAVAPLAVWVACRPGEGDRFAPETPTIAPVSLVSPVASSRPTLVLSPRSPGREPCAEPKGPVELRMGETLTVDVCAKSVSSIDGLGAFAFDLVYPGELLQGARGREGVEPGPEVREAGFSCFLNDDRVDEAGETLARLACALFPLPSQGPRGDFLLGTVTLLVRARGETALFVRNAALHEAGHGDCIYDDRGCAGEAAADPPPPPVTIVIR